MNKIKLLIWMMTLALFAGIINTVAVFGYDGTTVSHVTGLVSKFAISVADGKIGGCFDLFIVIFAFLTGAIAAGIATGEKAFHLHIVYGCIVLAIGILILLPIFLSPAHSVLLFAFLMGLQNGMVVSFRGVLVRSTHMTGNLTDLGVYIGYKIRGDKKEKPVAGLVPALALSGFTLGGIIGILLYHWIGNAVFVAVSALYLLWGAVYFYLMKTCREEDFSAVS